jgi:hypothetical protein
MNVLVSVNHFHAKPIVRYWIREENRTSPNWRLLQRLERTLWNGNRRCHRSCIVILRDGFRYGIRHIADEIVENFVIQIRIQRLQWRENSSFGTYHCKKGQFKLSSSRWDTYSPLLFARVIYSDLVWTSLHWSLVYWRYWSTVHNELKKHKERSTRDCAHLLYLHARWSDEALWIVL